MHDYGLALFLIVAILRGLFVFFRWVFRGLKRMGTTGPTYQPPQPLGQYPTGQPAGMPSGTPLPSRPSLERPPLSTNDLPMRPDERSGPQAIAPGIAVTPSPRLLFRSQSDLLRALVMQEILGPPLSKRDGHRGAGPP